MESSKEKQKYYFNKVSGVNWTKEIVIESDNLKNALEIFGADDFSKNRLSKYYATDIYEVSCKVGSMNITLGTCHKRNND